jgi:hypothetical protein|tara:strand:- start:327 stop:554 length:228 start_codon:yes stop_codon:yes gene_type:complete
MKSVTDVYQSVWNQQLILLKEIKNTIYSSGNLKGIPQWRDRKRFYQLEQKHSAGEYLLSKKDFQFLESLHFKYKV